MDNTNPTAHKKSILLIKMWWKRAEKKSVRRKTQTVGRLFGDSKHNLILWCIQIQHTEGGIGDDDACVLLHMDAVYRDNWDSVFLSVLKFLQMQI